MATGAWVKVPVSELGADHPTVLTGPFGTSLGRSDFVSAGVPVLTISCLTENGIDASKALFVSEQKASELARYRLRPGDLLFSRMATVGRVGIVTEALDGAIFNYHLMRLRLDQERLLHSFFAYFVKGAPQVRRYLNAVNHGATRDGINTGQLLGLEVPTPTIDRQRAIVAEIETQFSRLDASVAALKRAQVNLKRYKASVLKAACEGRLVPTEAELARRKGRSYESGADLLALVLEERRRTWSGRGRYVEPAGPGTAGLADLPEGWAWANAGQLATIVGGLTKNPKRDGMATKLPYLRVANVYANELRLTDIETIGVEEAELPKLLLKRGDLLIVEGNGSRDQIGRVAIWDGSVEPCVHQNHLIKARPRQPQEPKWILMWLLSPQGRAVIERVASSTSGLHTLSVGKVANLLVAVPPLIEQTRIVAEVERRLSATEAAEKAVQTALQRAARLRQAVLARAFSGGGEPA